MCDLILTQQMPNDAKSYFRKEKLITLDDTNEQKKNQISRNNILYCTQSQKSYYIIKSAFTITLKTI